MTVAIKGNGPDVGRLVFVGFDGPVVDDHARFALRELGAGGVVLFKRNYQSVEQLLDLTAALRDLSPRARLFITVDQEGGTVQRFREPFTIWPDAASFAERGDARTAEHIAERFGRAVGRELAAAGVDWNFAPVADVNTNPANPVIGRRAFSSDPAVAGRFAAAYVRGLQGAGVMACAKHFPGHGDTSVDSHLDLPVLDHDRARLDAVELVPFRACAAAGVASIMTAHVLWPRLDPDHPATLSPVVLGSLLPALDFDGLIVSDDLEMAAVADRYETGDAAARAVAAGCHILLVCKTPERQEAAVRGLHDAARSGRLSDTQLAEAHRRLDRAAHRFPFPFAHRPGPDVIGADEHVALARGVPATA